MEKEEFNLRTQMADVAKGILRQSEKIEGYSRQMSKDIIYYIMCYFERTECESYSYGTKIYKFKKPYVAQGFDTPITAIIYCYKYKFISVELADKETKLLRLMPTMEQAKLFEHFVSDINANSVYVVIEEMYDEMPSSDILAVFKDLERAQEYIVKRRKQRAFEKQYIWEQAKNENSFSNPQAFVHDKNRYFISSSEYIYDIRIVCKEML